jgi:hypothetical protein
MVVNSPNQSGIYNEIREFLPLIGGHFRTLVQTATFALNGLIDAKQLNMWKAVGELSGFLPLQTRRYLTSCSRLRYLVRLIKKHLVSKYIPKTGDTYQHNFQIAIHNVMDCFTDADPRKIIAKIKLHLLCHLPEDVNRFGPLVGLSSERFESFIAVFRQSSVYSNRHNPSMISLGNKLHKSGWRTSSTALLSHLMENPWSGRRRVWTY